MTKMRILALVGLFSVSFCGCESLQRFEAWKRETFLGEPPAQPMAPTYPIYGYQQPQQQAAPLFTNQTFATPTYAQPAAAPARNQPAAVRVQPAALPATTATQPAKQSTMPPMAQPVSQPIIVQTSG